MGVPGERHVSLSLVSQVKTGEWSLSRKPEADAQYKFRWLHNFRMWQICEHAQGMGDRNWGAQVRVYERGERYTKGKNFIFCL